MEEGHVDVNAFSVSPNEVMIQWPLNASDNLSSLNVLNLQTNGNIPPSYIHTHIYRGIEAQSVIRKFGSIRMMVNM